MMRRILAAAVWGSAAFGGTGVLVGCSGTESSARAFTVSLTTDPIYVLDFP